MTGPWAPEPRGPRDHTPPRAFELPADRVEYVQVPGRLETVTMVATIVVCLALIMLCVTATITMIRQW